MDAPDQIECLKSCFCKACGKSFLVKMKANNVKWCSACRYTEKLRVGREYCAKYFYKGERKFLTRDEDGFGHKKKRFRGIDLKPGKYINHVCSQIIFGCRREKRRKQRVIKHRKMFEYRKKGFSLRSTGKKFNLSYERIRQICAEYN